MEFNICHQILANCDNTRGSVALEIIYSGGIAAHTCCVLYAHTWNWFCHWFCSLAQMAAVEETGKVCGSAGGRGFPNLRYKYEHNEHTELTRQQQAQDCNKKSGRAQSCCGTEPSPAQKSLPSSPWVWAGAASAMKFLSQGRTNTSSATFHLEQELLTRAQGSVSHSPRTILSSTREGLEFILFHLFKIPGTQLSLCWRHRYPHTDIAPCTDSTFHLSFLIRANDRKGRAPGQFWCLKTQMINRCPPDQAPCALSQRNRTVWFGCPEACTGLGKIPAGMNCPVLDGTGDTKKIQSLGNWV